MIVFVDIDETICHTPGSPDKPRDYLEAVPKKENIEQINKLFDEGKHIVYWTSRGALTGIDWRDVTEMQLRTWGAKFHELRLDKPYFDLFIDDKVENSYRYFCD